MGRKPNSLIQIPDAVDWLDLQFGQTVFSCALYQMLRCGGSYIYSSCFYRWCHLQQTKYLRSPTVDMSIISSVTKKQRVPYTLAASCLEGPFQLLAAVENERNLRSRRNARHEDYEMNIDNSYGDDSDFGECIMRHFAAAARRARYVERRGRPRSSGIGPPLVLLSVPPGDLPLPDVQHMRTTSPEECQTSSYEFSEGDSPTFSTLRSVVPEVVNVEPNSVSNRDGCNKPRVLCSPESPQRPSSTEFLAFSESVKSKFSVASARYKESISKSTRGFKEKLLAHNISVKELGTGVQRERNAGIAGAARMIERLDLPSKRTGISVPLSIPSQVNWIFLSFSLEGDVVKMRTSAQLWVPHFILPMKAFTLCRTIRNQSRRLRK
ncbi:unnamed protein product [Camellia sinensis]